jgi:hypothetical protein
MNIFSRIFGYKDPTEPQVITEKEESVNLSEYMGCYLYESRKNKTSFYKGNG